MLVLELLCATKNLMEADIKCLANWWDSFVFSCGKLERKQKSRKRTDMGSNRCNRRNEELILSVNTQWRPEIAIIIASRVEIETNRGTNFHVIMLFISDQNGQER